MNKYSGLQEQIKLPPRIMPLLLTGTNAMADVLRLDEVHPVISGNKWYKLKYSLEAAKAEGKKRITTFGGAFSNHIVATACACAVAGMRSRGIIRGEAGEQLTPSLTAAQEYGMELEFISRSIFKELRENGFRLDSPDFIVPEGGMSRAGARGAAEILDGVPLSDYTHIVCAIGTGTTAAGLLQRISEQQKLICINVLKGGSFQQKDIVELSGQAGHNLYINNEFHFGGYAKYNSELLRFINNFFIQTGVPSDIVYTGKLFYAVQQLAATEWNQTGIRLLVIHSGGLQGNDSLPKGTLIF